MHMLPETVLAEGSSRFQQHFVKFYQTVQCHIPDCINLNTL